MKHKYISIVDSKHLLLIFAGWGMDERLFADLSHPSYDIMVVWDYRELGELPSLEQYDEVCVIAWSMGVMAAQRYLSAINGKLGRCIAVNGTPRPVDDVYGIPIAIFNGTLAGLDERNLAKFIRRMCGSADAYQAFMGQVPERGIDELRDELRILGEMAMAPVVESVASEPMTYKHGAETYQWDLAIMSSEDGIFPIKNQRAAWANTPTVEMEWPHLPDFAYLISHFLIDKPLVGKRFTEALGTYDDNASVQAAIAGDLWMELLNAGWAERHPRFASSYNASTVIEIGPGTGIFTSLYAPDIDDSCDWQLWDIANLEPAAVRRGARFIRCDAEKQIRQLPDASVDYILSNCAVQWFNSPQRFLDECARVLKPGGILAFSTFDPDNLPELRQAMPEASVLATPSVEQWRSMVPETMQLVTIKRGKHAMVFSSPRDVLEHMRGTGVNALSRPSLSAIRSFITRYPRLLGGCPLTYLSLLLILRHH